MIRNMVFFALALIMSGCGLYTKYQRPEVATEGLYRMDLWVDTVTSLNNLSWDELFADPYLQTLIRQGLEVNTDLNIARLKVAEAQAALLTAKLAYLPSLQLDPQGSLSGFDGGPVTKTYSLGGSASWELDLFGKLTNAKRTANAALEQSDAYRQAVQTQLIATVADSYYTLLMLDEQERVTEETLVSWDEYLCSLNLLMQAGEANRSAVNQAEASRLATQNSLLDIRRQIIEMENSLCAILGKVPCSVDRGTLSEQIFPEELSIGVPLALLSCRPDIKQAEAALKQQVYMTNQARVAFYPSITLGGSIGWTNSGGSVLSNPAGWLWQAIGSLVQPIFNKGTNYANFKIAESQQEEALLTFYQTLLDAGVEVNNAVIQWQTSRMKVVADEQQIERLQAVLQDTHLLMQYGTTNYLEVLIARQSLLSARLGMISDRQAEIQSVINLYHALGGGASL